jgi:molybdopterin converting factor small subunit
MNVTVLLFAQARERAGRGRVDLNMAPGSRVADVLRAVAREHPELEPLWPHLAVAVNGELAAPDVPLVDGAELALLPPVSGG